MSPRGRRNTNRTQLPFNRKLVLHQWLLGLFGVESFDQLAAFLREDSLEGVDENNVHRFHHALCLHLPAEKRPELPDDSLREYDEAIVAVTQRLNERGIARGEAPFVWKYFQYLALLFTEIYLDRYFRDPRGLLISLNVRIAQLNSQVDEADRLTPFDESTEAWPQLNKIAFWMATGSGKTLLMHAHILQYRRCLQTHGRTRGLNRIILLTPNEGLSRQHLVGLEKAGIEAELFDKDGRGLFTGQAVEIIEITKLKEEMGDKTVSVDAFEGENLVLVDEGHRGASAGGDGAWMKYRNALCEKGFSFEYSATFGQAVKGNSKLSDLYARNTLFDYSYRWFYNDGFGKDYQILNLESAPSEEWMMTYLTGCLLAFFQQQRLFRESEKEFRTFNVERPLLVFVGSSVTATLASRDATDIIQILRCLRTFLTDRSASEGRISKLLHDGLVTASGHNLFAKRFKYLNTTALTPGELFQEMLRTLFNSSGGGLLQVENLNDAPGEIALRLGDNEPFGVINVGDDKKLLDLCQQDDFEISEREFSSSLFQSLNASTSTVNVLIGSKKFSEGWDSYRVSTMGLMNVGKSEGAQIIQLFGRGIRLKGYATSLKRSLHAPIPDELNRPKHIELLETLEIFGVRASYMSQFREFLADEGLKTDTERDEIILPVKKQTLQAPLKTVRLKQTISGVSTTSGTAFRQLGPIPTVQPPNPEKEQRTLYLCKNKIVVNWYPKVRGMKSGEMAASDEGVLDVVVLQERHLAFVDFDRLYFDLDRHRRERGWHNLNLSREELHPLLLDARWYKLLIPASEMTFDSFTKVRLWEEIALALLKKYMDRYYSFRKREWEMAHLEYAPIGEDDSNFPTLAREGKQQYGYTVYVDASDTEMLEQLKQLKQIIDEGQLTDWEFAGLKALSFGRHLYEPILSFEGNRIQIAPSPLNKGERRFVEDLRLFLAQDSRALKGRDIYLLRNRSRGRGLGFFEAGNFFPDFLLWQLNSSKQHISFVDPKGLVHVDGPEDPKISFHETIKEIQQRLNDPNIELESFIVSVTSSQQVMKSWGIDKAELARRHVLFQEEDCQGYISAILGA